VESKEAFHRAAASRDTTMHGLGRRPLRPKFTHRWGPTANCREVLAAAAGQNGFSFDGTPIIRSGNELNFLEGQPGIPPQFGLTAADQPPLSAPCAAEGKEDPAGGDGGAVWLVCPTIPDPTQGGIAQDAFLDTVRRRDGTPIDPRFTQTFECLRDKGQFCSQSQAQGAGLASSVKVNQEFN
jgi:hypothetical protein